MPSLEDTLTPVAQDQERTIKNTMRNERAYKLAQGRYAEWEIDTERVIQKLASISISLHCWQGDDVTGFEHTDGKASQGSL